jgi:hypothetical protein
MGHFAAGGAIDFYALEKVGRLGAEAMGYAIPQRLPVANGDPIAVLKGATHPAAAGEFVSFVLSETGQKLWYLPPGVPDGPREFALGRLPVWKDAYQANRALAQTNPFEIEGLGNYDFAKTGHRWPVLDALLGAAILDPHDRLQQAWSALIGAGMPEDGLSALGEPPCGEQEFMELAACWRNMKVSERNRIAAEWGRWARAKYARVTARYALRR